MLERTPFLVLLLVMVAISVAYVFACERAHTEGRAETHTGGLAEASDLMRYVVPISHN